MLQRQRTEAESLSSLAEAMKLVSSGSRISLRPFEFYKISLLVATGNDFYSNY
jgi:hypothetical protein